MSKPDSAAPPPSTAVVHFYRAVVGHADVWRQRMDATTNWAAATTAAMVTFSFGNDAPHFVLLIALAFDAVFLLMEARRYRVYHLWHQRFHRLNRFMVAPALMGEGGPPAEEVAAEMRALAQDLGRTAPRLGLLSAIGFRIHRNYGFIFGIVLLTWLLKLNVTPERAESVEELVARAQIGGIPGAMVMAAVAGFLAWAAVLAALAPSERMIDWVESPRLLNRWAARVRRARPRHPGSGRDA